jgi:hypothetical protein
MRLLSCVLDAPVERIRGSEKIRVSVRATFNVSGQEVAVSGLAVTSVDSEVSLREAFKQALADAESNVKLILERNKKGEDELASLVKDLIQPRLEDKRTREKQKLENDPRVVNMDETIKKLNGPADENRQNTINDLCETLGIEPIIIIGENPWTLLEALALIEELKQRTTKFEARE